MSGLTSNLIVQGDVVAPFLLLKDVSTNATLIDVLDLIKSQRPQVVAFNFHRDENSTEVLRATTKISALLDDDGMKVVYVKSLPAAGAYSHELTAIFAFSRLND